MGHLTRLIVNSSKFKKENEMDRKTTFAGAITAIAALVASFGFSIDPKYVTAILAVGAGVIGFFAKDSA